MATVKLFKVTGKVMGRDLRLIVEALSVNDALKRVAKDYYNATIDAVENYDHLTLVPMNDRERAEIEAEGARLGLAT